MSRTEIKQIAKTEFKDHWGVLLLILALTWVAKGIAAVLGFGIGSIIADGPLCVGIYYAYTKTIYNEGTDWKDLFFGFRTMFADSFVVRVLIWFIILLVDFAIVFIVVVITFIINIIVSSVPTGGNSYDYYSSEWSSALATIGTMFAGTLILIVAVIALIIIFGLIYAEAPLLLLKEPGIRPVDALKKSRLMMKGNKGRLFIFMLSYLGWFILCFLTLGVLFVYVAPYYMYAKVLLLNQIYDEKHSVSMDNDADMQKLNAMRESVRSRTEAVTDKIKDKAGEARPAAPPTEPESPAEPVALPNSNICKYCGAELPEGAMFCGKCGRKQ